MRFYNEINSELFYFTPYVKYRLSPDGFILEHSITGTEIKILVGRKEAAHILKLLIAGAKQSDIESALDRTEMGNGKLMFVSLIVEGMIE